MRTCNVFKCINNSDTTRIIKDKEYGDLCRMHYLRKYKTGSLKEDQLPLGSIVECIVDNCERKGAILGDYKGYCYKHIYRLKHLGSIEEPVRHKAPICKISICDRKNNAHGYCPNHFAKYRYRLKNGMSTSEDSILGIKADSNICTVHNCSDAKKPKSDYCINHSKVKNGVIGRGGENRVTEKHGKHNTPTYRSWQAMKGRCLNKNASNYHYYGGRGITIYKDWIYSFQKFYEDVGERPPGTSLDRIDVNGDYTPDNVRWATYKTQSNNRRLNKVC